MKGAYEVLEEAEVESLHSVTNIWKYMQNDVITHYLPKSLKSEIAEAKEVVKKRTTLLEGLPEHSNEILPQL